MILIDWSRLSIAAVMAQLGIKDLHELDLPLCRHIILNMILHIKRTHRNYGPMVFACDTPPYWRKDIFPYYKANRKRDDSGGFSWDDLFKITNQVRDEIKQNFPYVFLQVPGCEADDVIAVLTKQEGNHLVVAKDKDFLQLLQRPNVTLWDPTKKKAIQHPNPTAALIEHVMMGDKGDGVPSIVNHDDIYVKGIKAKPVTKKMKDAIAGCTSFAMAEALVPGYWHRNRTLIDFDMIPEEVEIGIVDQYQNAEAGKWNAINYLAEHKLRKLLESADEF